MSKRMSLSEYVSHWNSMSQDFSKFAKKFLLDEAVMIKNEAIKNSPVLTGAMRSSWRVGNEKSSLVENPQTNLLDQSTEKGADLRSVKQSGGIYSVTISNGQEYASFHEYGTKRGIEARYMVTKPLNEYSRTRYRRFKKKWDDYRRKKGLD